MKLLAGDWKDGIQVLIGPRELVFQKGFFSYDRLPLSEIADFEVVSEQNKASILGKVGWGAVGAIALGPVGLLAGALGGGNKQHRVMSILFKDGRKALVKGTAKDVETLTTVTFNLKPTAAPRIEERQDPTF